MKRQAFFAILIISIFSFYHSHSQDDKTKRQWYNEADYLNAQGDYEKAIKILKKLVNSEPNNPNFNFQLGYALHKSYNYESPIPYLEVAVTNVSSKFTSNYKDKIAPIESLELLAKEYQYAYEFSKAKNTLQEYKKHVPAKNIKKHAEIEDLMINCNFGSILFKIPKRVHHSDMGAATSLRNYTHSPVFSPDESIYIFTADIQPDKEILNLDEIILDDNIYMIKYNAYTHSWSIPKQLPKVNSSKQEASLGMSPDGKTLYMYRNDNGDGNLYYSESDGLNFHSWSKPKKFDNPINSSSQESHITISSDGNIAFFTSNRKGSLGGLDIWMCIKKPNGKWSEEINLGKKINTEFHEESPHMQAYGNYLYFSSNRKEGMGEFDIYKATLRKQFLKDAYQNIDMLKKNIDSLIVNVENIGYPINTPRNDLFFKTSIDGKKGYYAVQCQATKGEYDLNIVEFLDGESFPNTVVKGVVIGQNEDTIRNMEVNLFELDSKDYVTSNKTSKQDGYYNFELFSTKKYFVAFEKDGNVYFSQPFKVKKYFTDLSFSNVIILEPFRLKDMVISMSYDEFREFKNNIIRNKYKLEVEDESSLRKIFSQLLTEKPVSISRKDSKVPTFIKKFEDKVLSNFEQNLLDRLNSRNGADTLNNLSQMALDSLAIADSLFLAGSQKLRNYRYDSSMVDFESALIIYEDLKIYNSAIACLDKLSEIWSIKGRNDYVLNYQLQALDIILLTKDKNLEAHQKLKIGDTYYTLYNKENALVNYLESLDLFKSLNDSKMSMVVMEKIADLYASYGDYTTSLSYLEEIATNYQDSQDKKKLAEIFNKLGLVYDSKKEFNTAINYFLKSIDISKEIEDKRSLSIYLNNLGNTHFNMSDFLKAIQYYNLSADLKREIEFEDGLALTLYNLGNTHKNLKDYLKAIGYFDESLEISEKINETDLQTKNHFALSSVYETTKKFKRALFHFEKYLTIRAPYLTKRDSLQLPQYVLKFKDGNTDIQKLSKLLNDQKANYKSDLILQESVINELKQDAIMREQTRMMLTLLLVAIIILLLLIILRFRNKRIAHSQLKTKNSEILQLQEEISQQHNQLELINLELEKLSLVASKTENAVAILDENANFEWVNNAFIATFGKNIEELNTEKEFSILKTTKHEEARNAMIECLSYKKTVNFEAPKLTGDGHEIWVQTSLTPLVNDDKITKIISIESNIHELKIAEQEILFQKNEIEKQRNEIEKQRDLAIIQKEKIEQQKNDIEKTIEELHSTQKKLVESEKMASLGNLVAGISHEINTPVGVGIIASTTLQTRTKDFKTLFEEKKMKQSDLQKYLTSAKESARLILTNLQRTGDLVKSFKRVSVDEITEQLRTFELNEYIDDILRSLEPKLNEKNIEVQVKKNEDIELNNYPGAFAQIITNFVINALNHAFTTTVNNKITIETINQEDRAILLFNDNGKGMTKDIVEKIFDPFFTTNMQTGTGLGLNIVYNIATQKLKGSITCNSVPNEGTTFTVEFPKRLDKNN